ncbi:hypothetical protein [Streptomyces sp. NPDC015350]|uniref:hypothetical protein n=1 Tax=Streptomyces sp. NPDC015350 TaxID=3364955 RepID=UPI0036F72F2F
MTTGLKAAPPDGIRNPSSPSLHALLEDVAPKDFPGSTSNDRGVEKGAVRDARREPFTLLNEADRQQTGPNDTMVINTQYRFCGNRIRRTMAPGSPKPRKFVGQSISHRALELMNMKKTTLRTIGTAAAASFLAAGILGTSASNSFASPQSSQAAPSVVKCYSDIDHPSEIVCYQVSQRATNTGSQIVFWPFLIQVPTPLNPPAPVIVNVLPPDLPSAGFFDDTGQLLQLSSG